MIENKGAIVVNPHPYRKYFIFGIAFVLVLVVLVFLNFQKPQTCGDGTLYEQCSEINPYFCEQGQLVERASVCGCSETLTKDGDSCILEGESRIIPLSYFFEGEEHEINFKVYESVNENISSLSRVISYSGNETPSRADFKLKQMNEPLQRQMLLPLVVEIQNRAKNKKDQFRIATSIVQSVTYGKSNKTLNFFGNNVSHSRYPYEVVFDNEGICGEKSQLLTFLLRELGFETALFYFQDENHEAVGVKCPRGESFDKSGFCFVETTGRVIATDDSIEFVGGVKLDSEPQIFQLSEGDSLPRNLKEYRDADRIEKLRNNRFVFFREKRLKNLEEKYGIGKIKDYNLE